MDILKGIGFGKENWLHDKPEEEAYDLIIDSHRMRVEDEFNFQGIDQGLYAGEDPVPGFRRFLIKAEKTPGALPPWWNAEKREACIRKGDSENQWSNLHSAVEKSDIQEHYNNNTMPMKLRMFAEEIIGTNVMKM